MRAPWLVAGLLAVSTPAAAQMLRGVAEVGVGLGYSCARTDDGRVYCWGRSDWRHLPGPRSSPRPIEITLPSPARRLWVRGDMPACVELARDGALWCWGGHESLKAVVDRSPGVVDLHSTPLLRCALFADGTVRCGRGAMQLVEGLSDVEQLGVSGEHACVRSKTGAVRCWRNGERPTVPKGLDRGAVDLAVMMDGACVIVTGGAVRCWGEAGMDKPVRFGTHPTAIALPAPAKQLAAWTNGVHVLLSDGALMTLGHGYLGSGKYVRSPRPVRVASGVTALAPADMFARTSEGWQCFGPCTGSFDEAQFGPSGLPAAASAPVHDVASAVTCAVGPRGDGSKLLCRGPNDVGQLGDGGNVDRRVEWRPVLAPDAR